MLPAPILSRQATGRHTTVLGGMRWCVMVPPNGSGKHAQTRKARICALRNRPDRAFEINKVIMLRRS
jgi:hypothetical protein